MNSKQIDMVLFGSLIALLLAEFWLKSSELYHTQVLIGIIVGFGMGFKLEAMHGITVSRQAIELAKKRETELEDSKGDMRFTKDSMMTELRRKEKVIAALHQSLLDRDDDVRMLVSKLEKKTAK